MLLGFDSLGRPVLGQISNPSGAAPTETPYVFSSFAAPSRKKLAVAVIATTFAGFVAPPQPARAAAFTQFSQPTKKKPVRQAIWNFSIPVAQTQTAIFTQFSQPRRKVVPAAEQPQGLFTTAPALPPFTAFSQFSQPRKAPSQADQANWQFETVPSEPPFTGFAQFSTPLRPTSRVVLFSAFQPVPIVIPPADTHDGVFVKRKRKKGQRDPIDLELEERSRRRAAIELAVYGPEVTYEPPPALITPPAPRPPPNVEDLARIIVQTRTAEMEAQRQALEQDDEEVLEMILRDL